MLTEQEIINEKQQLNEVAPLLAFLFGIFAKAGYDREKARRAAEAAAGAAEQQAPGAANAVNQQGQPQRPTGILKNGEMIRTGDMVKELQTYLGFQGSDIDGKFGPKTERAVRTFQQNSGLRVDGIVGPNTIEKIRRMAQSGNTPSVPGQRPAARDGGIAPGTTSGGPSRLRQRTTNGDGGITDIERTAGAGGGLFDSIEETNMAESINEEITITGDPESLLRMMKLAGATDAKEVDAGDINPNVGSSCGNRNGDLARSIELMADENWDNSPDEDIADFDANPPSNDLNKSKTSHPPVAGGDNPMALEDELRAKLQAALEEKKSPAGGPACWDGKKIHPTKPTKMKGGEKVNNCIDADSSDGK